MNKDEIVKQIAEDLKEVYNQNDGGHDWYHINRVWKLAQEIQAKEGGDKFIIEISILTHDLIDKKLKMEGFDDYDDVASFLREREVEDNDIKKVLFVIKHVSYMSKQPKVRTLELDVVQDADRVDALGAIGIARLFMFTGAKDLLLHDPNIKPRTDMIGSDTISKTAINHFYEKILLIKEKMNTNTGKKMTEERHEFVEKYLEQFNKEWI